MAVHKKESLINQTLILDGNELLALTGGEPGPWLGALKDYLCRQVEGGLLAQDDKESAAKLAVAWLNRGQQED